MINYLDVQIYKPDDLTKVYKVFNGIVDAMRNVKHTNNTHIKIAVKHKKVYMGYRWFFIDKDCAKPNKAQKIGKTCGNGNRLYDYIVMLNKDKTQIIKLFSTQREAADDISRLESALSNAVKNHKMLDDKYWMLWSNIDEELQIKYLENNALPPRYKNNSSYTINKINPITNKIILTYASLSDACRDEQISAILKKKCSIDDSIYKNYKWKIIK